MQRKLNQDDFERFIQECADDLRMIPTEKTWNKIAAELDRKKSRMAGIFALFLLLLSGTYVTWELATTPLRQTGQPATFPQSLIAANSPNVAKDLQTPAHPNTKAQPAQVATLRPARQSNALPVRTIGSDTVQGVSTLADAAPASGTILPEAQSTDKMLTGPVASTALNSGREPMMADPLRNAGRLTGTEVSSKPFKLRKVSWQVFAAPTISYRQLSENQQYQRPLLSPATPANVSALYNVENAVIHKPDLGLEFGLMARYPVSRALRIRTGFQFNIARYDIKAFSFVSEVATIALNNGPRVDSVRAISNYRNTGNTYGNWLQNISFQASMPLGMELQVWGNDKVQLGVASSVQPTYVIGNRSYLITADYKNYARVPWLSRRWNVNTNLETFITYKAGKTQLQVGPQVRYQVLSSFVREYPVKEHLFDYGLKVGVTLK